MNIFEFKAYYKPNRTILEVLVIDFISNTIKLKNEDGSCILASLSDVEIVYSSGIKDTNAKLLWEGDILKSDSDSERYVVKYSSKKAGFGALSSRGILYTLVGGAKCWQKIGSIYDKEKN